MSASQSQRRLERSKQKPPAGAGAATPARPGAAASRHRGCPNHGVAFFLIKPAAFSVPWPCRQARTHESTIECAGSLQPHGCSGTVRSGQVCAAARPRRPFHGTDGVARPPLSKVGRISEGSAADPLFPRTVTMLGITVGEAPVWLFWTLRVCLVPPRKHKKAVNALK